MTLAINLVSLSLSITAILVSLSQWRGLQRLLHTHHLSIHELLERHGHQHSHSETHQ